MVSTLTWKWCVVTTSVVSTLLWLPCVVTTLLWLPCIVTTLLWWLCGFHHLVVTMCGFHPPVVTTLPWWLCGDFMVSTLSWLPCVVTTLPWLPLSCSDFMVSCVVNTLLWLACVVTILPWLPVSHGFHPPVVIMCGFHPPVVTTLCGYQSNVVSRERERESCYKTHLTSMAAKKEETSPASFWVCGFPASFWMVCLDFGLNLTVNDTFCVNHSGDSMVTTVPWLPCVWLPLHIAWILAYISLEMTTFMVTHGVHGVNNIVVTISVKSHSKVMWPP